MEHINDVNFGYTDGFGYASLFTWDKFLGTNSITPVDSITPLLQSKFECWIVVEKDGFLKHLLYT